jgi:hypothetical protein
MVFIAWKTGEINGNFLLTKRTLVMESGIARAEATMKTEMTAAS